MAYDTVQIRQFVKDTFSDEELTTFCYDHFRDVYESFSAGLTKTQKIQLLIEHCQRRGVWSDLMALLRKERPDQFAEYFPQVIIPPTIAPASATNAAPNSSPVASLPIQSQAGPGKKTEGVSPADQRHVLKIGAIVMGSIAVLACAAAWLVVPEFRQFLGLDGLIPTSIAVGPTSTATSIPKPTATSTSTLTLTPTSTPTPGPTPGRVGFRCTLVSTGNNNDKFCEDVFEMQPQPVSSISISMTNRAIPIYGYSIWEVEAYESITSTTNLISTTVGVQATATSNEDDLHSPQNATDGNMPTRWASAWSDKPNGKDPQVLTIMFPKPITVGRIVIKWQDAYAFDYCVGVYPGNPCSMPSSAPAIAPTSVSASAPVSSPVSIGTLVPMPTEVISTTNADRLALLARWGKGKATQIMYSPDGKYLAVLSYRGIYIYDAQTRQELRFIPSSSIYYSAAFVPQADTLLVSHYESFYLTPLSGDGLSEKIGVDYWVSSVAASPDGEWLAVGQDGGSYGVELQLWQWKKSFVPAFTRTYPAPIRSLAFSPDSKTLAVGLKDGTIHLLTWQDHGQPDRVLSGHTESVWSLAFSPKGTWLASGGDDGTFKVWRWQELTGTTAYSGTYKGNVYGVAFGPGNTEDWLTLGLGDGENKVRVVPTTNQANKPPPFDQLTYPNSVLSVAYSPDGNTLGIVTSGTTVELRQAANGQPLASLTGFTQGSVGDLFFMMNDQVLWSGMYDDTGICQWQVANGQSDYALQGDLSTGRIAASPDLRYAAATIWDHYVRVWNTKFPTTHQDWDLAPDHDPRRVAFSNQGLLAAGTDRGTVWVWKMPNDAPLFTLTHTSAITLVNAVEFSPNGEFLAVGAEDGTVRIWRMADHSLAFELPKYPKAVNDVTFSPDGSLLAVSTADGQIRIVEVSSGKIERTLDNGSVQAEEVSAFAPSGDLLAVTLSDGNAKVWSASRGDLLTTLDGHNAYVRGVAFSKNGRLLATGADDATICLWGIPPK